MSVIPHNPLRFKEVHGIRLAPGSSVANLIIERVAQDPATLEVGRFWYNIGDKQYKLVNIDNDGKVYIQVLPSAQTLADALDTLLNTLASTEAGKGTDLIGFAGIKNGETEVVSSGTLTSKIVDLYSKVANVANSSGTLSTDLTSVEEGKGGELVGFSGSATLVSDNVSDAIKEVDAKVATLEDTVGDGRFLLTEGTAAQSVASQVTFKDNIVIEGDIIHRGDNLIVEGTTVSLGDNIIALNNEVAEDSTPVADAGLSVNRGKEGTSDFLLWKEDEKQVKALKVTVEDVEGVPSEVRTLERVVLASDLDAAKTELNQAITNLGAASGDDLDALTGTVSDLSDEFTAYKADVLAVDADKGSKLVGYSNSDTTGEGVEAVTRTAVVLDGKTTVKDALDTIVDAVEKGAKDLNSFSNSLSGSEGLSNIGGGLIAGIDSEYDKYSYQAQSLVQALSLAYSKINEVSSLLSKKVISITSPSNVTHVIEHNLGTEDVSIDLWIRDNGNWRNHLASIEINNINGITVYLSQAAEIKVIITKVDDYTRMVGDTLEVVEMPPIM